LKSKCLEAYSENNWRTLVTVSGSKNHPNLSQKAVNIISWANIFHFLMFTILCLKIKFVA